MSFNTKEIANRVRDALLNLANDLQRYENKSGQRAAEILASVNQETALADFAYNLESEGLTFGGIFHNKAYIVRYQLDNRNLMKIFKTDRKAFEFVKNLAVSNSKFSFEIINVGEPWN